MKIQSHEIDDIIKNSEYAIYVLIGEHVWRIHTNSSGFSHEYIWPRYDKKKYLDNVVLIKHKSYVPFWEGSYLFKYIQKIFFTKILTPSKMGKIQNYLFDDMKLHLETIRNDIKEINPNIKMIIIKFPDDGDALQFINSPRWKELENEGFLIVNVEDIIENPYEDQYVVPNDGHPSELAWDLIRENMVNDLKCFD